MILGVVKAAMFGSMIVGIIGRGPVDVPATPPQLPIFEEISVQDLINDTTETVIGVVETVYPGDLEEEGILNEYVSGVIEDTEQYTEELGVIIDEYVADTQDIVEDMLQNPDTTPEDMADEVERRAEQFADDLEDVSEIYGHVQEIAGDAFGNKFDQDTAGSIIDLVTDIFGRH